MKFILVCSMIWMVLFFLALPFGIEVPKKVEKGIADSAPSKHYLGQKLFFTLILSMVMTIIYWYLV